MSEFLEDTRDRIIKADSLILQGPASQLCCMTHHKFCNHASRWPRNMDASYT